MADRRKRSPAVRFLKRSGLYIIIAAVILFVIIAAITIVTQVKKLSPAKEQEPAQTASEEIAQPTQDAQPEETPEETQEELPVDESVYVPPFAAGIQRRKKISGRAAGIGRHGGVAVGVRRFCGKIDEQLAERGNIKHGFFVPFHYFAAGYSLHNSRYGGSSSSISGKRPTGGLKRLSALSSLHWLTSPSSTSPVPGSTVKS